ncbi:extracellular solute-binding protein (plasmid) [Rhizobium sullae]|uniref:Extracellular solute-binding protein n=1 Tax=Rhizobium sullae TaxID=50338 RepID=A0ABY5XV37_RHISU|nr:extracellular solute-binding protein [Rhizobium sullae]UWU17832.1 extracellular solute-binding protein [Rhizobium sullae]
MKMRKLVTATLAVSMFAMGAARAADLSWMGYSYAEESAKPSVEKIIAGFTAKTGKTVEPIPSAFGDLQKNVFLRARSKTLPSVVQISERWLPSLSKLPGLVDYNTVFGKENLEKIYAPEALAMGQIDGKQLAVPLMSGSIGMVANQAALTKAGITDLPTTVEEFKADLVAIRDKVPNSVPYAMATKNNSDILVDFLTWEYVFGAHVIDPEGKVVVDSDASRKALAFLVDLMKERLVAPEIGRPDARRLVGQSAAAFYLDAPQSRTFLRSFSGQGPAFDANIKPMQVPVVKAGDTPVSIQWAHLIISFAQNSPPTKEDANMQFIAYLGDDAVETQFPVEQSALPGTKSARANPVVASDAYLSAWAKNNTHPRRNEVGIWSNGGELTDILAQEVQAALLGQKSADEAISSMSTRMKASMTKAGHAQ